MRDYHTLHKIGADVAKHLPGWRYDTLEHYQHLAEIIGPDRQRFYLQWDKGYNKIRVSGCFPDMHSLSNNRHGSCSNYSSTKGAGYSSIGLSADKGIKAIADDIKRRFIPGYVAAFHLALKEKKQFQDKCMALQYRADALAKVAPGLYDDYHYKRKRGELSTSYRKRGQVSGCGVSVEMSTYSDTVRLELDSLSTEKAIKILAIINN